MSSKLTVDVWWERGFLHSTHVRHEIKQKNKKVTNQTATVRAHMDVPFRSQVFPKNKKKLKPTNVFPSPP